MLNINRGYTFSVYVYFTFPFFCLYKDFPVQMSRNGLGSNVLTQKIDILRNKFLQRNRNDVFNVYSEVFSDGYKYQIKSENSHLPIR